MKKIIVPLMALSLFYSCNRQSDNSTAMRFDDKGAKTIQKHSKSNLEIITQDHTGRDSVLFQGRNIYIGYISNDFIQVMKNNDGDYTMNVSLNYSGRKICILDANDANLTYYSFDQGKSLDMFAICNLGYSNQLQAKQEYFEKIFLKITQRMRAVK